MTVQGALVSQTHLDCIFFFKTDEDSLTLYAKKANSNILRRSHNKAHSQILELLYSFEIQSRQDVHKKIPECQSSTKDSVGEQQETNPTAPQDAGATTESDLFK